MPSDLVVMFNGAEPPAGMVIETGTVATDISPVLRPTVKGNDNGGFSERLPTATEFGGAATTGGVITIVEATAATSD